MTNPGPGGTPPEGLLGNDSDPDGDPLAITEVDGNQVTLPGTFNLLSGAILTLNADGTFSYDPNGQFASLAVGVSDTDTFEYTIGDGNGGSDTATVNITIDGVNDAPTITSTPVTTATEDELYTYDVEAVDPDIGDTLTFSLDVAPTGMTIDATSGLIQWTPANAQVGSNAVATRVIDAGGLFDTQSFSVSVVNVNNAPVVTPSGAMNTYTAGNPAVVIDGAITVTDIDNANLASANITLTNRPDGDASESLAVITGGTGITSSYTPSTGELSLSGVDTLANYQQVLRTATYLNTATPLDETDRIVEFVVNDGSDDSNTGSVTVKIANNQPPVARDDDFTTDEDTVLNGDVLVDNGNGVDSDPDGDPLNVNTTPISGPTSGVLVLMANGGFTYTPFADFNGTDMFEYEIDDGKGGTDIGLVTIGVTSVNDVPTDIALDNASVDENQPIGTAVGVFTTTDVDTADTHLYSLVAGAGDTDNAQFSIVGDQLQTAAVLDFEAAANCTTSVNSCSIRVQTDDGNGGTFEKTFIINIDDVNEAPTDIALDSTTVDENAAIGTTVGTFTTTDVDAGDSHTYTLVAGAGDTDNTRFSIGGGASDELLTAEVFDFETQGPFSIRVRTTDSGGPFFEEPFTIIINDIDPENLAPTITSSATANFAENGVGPVLDVMTSDDNDSEGAGLSYGFTSSGVGPGIDNGLFNLATNGIITFISPPDFELPGDFNGDNNYQVQVTVTDSGPGTPLTDTQNITITVTDVAEADAIDDSYTGIIGNVGLDVPAGSGVLSNDLGGASTVTQVNGVGANVGAATATSNGTVTVQADGGFVYEPNAGNPGTDSFTYEADGVDTATVILTFGPDVIWFIDTTPSGGGNVGTLSDPFTSISGYNASSAAANQEVFIAAGSYTGPLNANNNSVVIGEGASGTTAGLLGVSEPAFSRTLPSVGGADPQIGGASSGINLASGNTIRGLDIGTTGGTALFGSSVGALSISEVDTVSASSGRAVDLSGGSGVSVDIGSVTVSSSSVGGINLDTNAGTFTFDSLSVSTTGGTGLRASSSGTVNIGGTGSTINSTSGTAIDSANTTIGTGGWTFSSVSNDQGSSGGDTPAIVLTNTGAGTFTVNGGTIENITDADGIRLSNTDGLVTLANMIIEDIADSSDASDALGTRSGVDGIHGQDVDGGLTLNNTIMRRFSDNAINGALFSNGLSETNWNGLSILNGTVIEDSNRFHVGGTGASGKADSSDEGLVRIVGITGTVVIDSSTLQRGAELIDFFTDSGTGTLDMTVQRSFFIDSIKEFVCGNPTQNVGKTGLDVTVEGPHDAVIRIGDPAGTNSALGNTFTNNATASVRIVHDAGTSGDIDVVISQNTFEITDHLTGTNCAPGNFTFNFAQGGVLLDAGAGTFEGIVSNNVFDEVMNASGGTGQLTLIGDDGGSSEFIVTGNEFRLPWNGPVRVLADGNGSMDVRFGGPNAGEPNTYTDGTLTGEDLGAGTFPSPFLPWQLNVRNGGSLDMTIRNEVLPAHDVTNSGFSESFDATMNSSGGTLNLWLDNNDSPYGYNLANSGAGTFQLYQGASGSTVPAVIIDDNNNTGGGGSDGTTPPTVTTSGTIGATSTAPTQPSITIP